MEEGNLSIFNEKKTKKPTTEPEPEPFKLNKINVLTDIFK